MELSFRYADARDTARILEFIRALAVYERLEDEVVATPELLRRWIFEERRAEVVFGLADGREAAFMLFFHNFSTFLGRAGVYLEDLFVLPEYRGRGVGRAMMRRLARITAERGCGRLEWSCLDWNEPARAFYRSLGAVAMDGWTVHRAAGAALAALAED